MMSGKMIILEVMVWIAFGGLGYLISYVRGSYKTTDKKEKPKAYIDYDYKKINDTFNDIIGDEFDIYAKYHPDMFQLGNSYIKSEDIKNLTSRLTTKVLNRMTPVMRNNLSLIYNFKDDTELINIIGERVGITVVNLAANINTSMNEDEVNLRIDE